MDDFFKEIILVSIPVGVGAILTHLVTRKWQTRSAKIKIKKEILESFAKSAQYQKNALHQFIGLFLRTYGNAKKDEYDFEKGTLFSINTTLRKDEIPKYRLQKEYDQMNQLYDKSKLSEETVFISLISLYYRDKDLNDDYMQIQKEIGYIRNIIYELMQDHEKGEDFMKLSSEYNKKLSELNKSISSFGGKLIQKDIII